MELSFRKSKKRWLICGPTGMNRLMDHKQDCLSGKTSYFLCYELKKVKKEEVDFWTSRHERVNLRLVLGVCEGGTGPVCEAILLTLTAAVNRFRVEQLGAVEQLMVTL